MKLTRRAVLRGAGITLALPWLESLGARGARANDALAPKRLLVVFFPNGSAEWWRPAQTGVGEGWQLSPILQPFAPLKEHMSVLTNVENHSPVGEAGTLSSTSDPLDSGIFLTGTDAAALSARLGNVANGVSMDQLIARGIGADRSLQSLVVGLSTMSSYCDNRDCRYSRNISWQTQTAVTPKLVDPAAVWDLVFKGVPLQQGRSPELDKSVLDAVADSTQAVRTRLGRADQQRLDAYLTSLRDLEQRIQAGTGCFAPSRPTAVPGDEIPINTETYNRADHAAVMNDLIALALQCGITRVSSYMLDDARTEFSYSHVKVRNFSASGSVAGTRNLTCGNYTDSMQAGPQNDEYASVNCWFSQVTSDLCQKLANMPEGDGSVLDNTVVLYGSSMHGSSHEVSDLPLVLLGGRGVLKQNQHYEFAAEPGDCALRDIHFTLMNEYFGLNVPSFGQSVRTPQNRTVTEILA